MLSRRELVKQHKSLLIMEGKCLKCRYHDLVVNSVCQLRLSQLWQQTAPGSEWLMTTKACLSLRHRFHRKSVQALFHVIFTLWLSLKEWALLWCVSQRREEVLFKSSTSVHVSLPKQVMWLLLNSIWWLQDRILQVTWPHMTSTRWK